ncbi:MAG: 2-dehydropantoate 2-reductase [Rubrivivax sp.]|nr:MAG: 2-dehydropantoate 2-reductase [Rubrivivax sp.]
MTHIAVLGPGAVGCTLTAWLMQNRSLHVTVLARSPLAGIEVRAPDRVLSVSPRVITQPSALPAFDWVLVTTKAYDSAAAAAWLAPLADSGASVAVLQNGVEHIQRFEGFFPRARLLPVMVDIPADRIAPGRVTQHRHGCMVVPAGNLGARFETLFGGMPISVSQSADFTTEAWRKLCLNAAGAFSAVVSKPAGIASHEGVAALMASLIREGIAVGRAEGAVLDESLVQDIVQASRSNPDAVNSMLADRLAGRPMEVDARNGVIARLGRRHGIATPMNDLVVALLQACQL